MSDVFASNTRVPQANLISTNKFIFYLAQALENEHQDQSHARNHFVLRVTSDNHCYPRKTSNLNINMEYADDLTSINTNLLILDQTIRDFPPNLISGNLSSVVLLSR